LKAKLCIIPHEFDDATSPGRLIMGAEFSNTPSALTKVLSRPSNFAAVQRIVFENPNNIQKLISFRDAVFDLYLYFSVCPLTSILYFGFDCWSNLNSLIYIQPQPLADFSPNKYVFFKISNFLIVSFLTNGMKGLKTT